MALPLQHTDACHVLNNNSEQLFFGGYDYLAMSWHPEVRKEFIRVMDADGLNTGGSRATTGNHVRFEELEAEIAEFTGLESACLFASGYLANLALFQALSSQTQSWLVESTAHPSLRTGLKLSDTRVRYFAPDDLRSLKRYAEELQENGHPLAFCAEGMRPLDGSLAPLEVYLKESGAAFSTLVLDEAHSLGIAGEGGRGLSQTVSKTGLSVYMTGSLSKTVGCYGGFIAGSSAFIRKLKESDIFRGSSAMPPPQAAAATASLRLLRSHPQWSSELNAKAERFKNRLLEQGIPVTAAPTPVIILSGETIRSSELLKILDEAGIYSSYIRYPGGPDEGFFRFALNRMHSDEMIEKLLAAILTARIQ